LAERNEKLTTAYGQIKTDLDAAAQFQRSLLPAKSLRFGQAECEWFCLPSLFVSGDELNAFHLDADHVGFYNLDVSGHGVPAAMMSATLSRMFSNATGNGGLLKQTRGDPPRDFILSPASVVSALNRQFQTTAENSMYFTLVYGVLNLHTGDVRLSQAGHTFPILVTSQRDSQLLGEPSPPVGFIPHADYKDCEITLQKGDRLFMYSDGITECEDGQGQVFGEDRLRALLDAQRGVSLESVLHILEAALYDWRGLDVAGFRDDVSMLAIEYR
jgi:sigma-B regulation protein RsbU (phosphoserine phosphatase)